MATFHDDLKGCVDGRCVALCANISRVSSPGFLCFFYHLCSEWEAVPGLVSFKILGMKNVPTCRYGTKGQIELAIKELL
jgi:hypothetical protein